MGLLDDAIREHLDLKRRHGASEDEIARKEAEALGPVRRVAPAAPALGAPELADDRGALGPDGDPEAAPPEHSLQVVAEDEAAKYDDEPDAAAYADDRALAASADAAAAPAYHDEGAPAYEDDPATHAYDPGPAPAGVDDEPSAPAEPDERSGLVESGGGEDRLRLPDEERAELERPPEVGQGPPPRGAPPGDDANGHVGGEAPSPESAADRPLRPGPAGSPAPGDRPLAHEAQRSDVLEETPDFLQETPEHDRLWFEQKPPRDFDFDD